MKKQRGETLNSAQQRPETAPEGAVDGSKRDFLTASRAAGFDAAAEAARLAAQSRERRRRSYRRRRSRLDPHTLELLALRDAGATVTELQRWLRDRRVKVSHSTVGRWLEKHGTA